MAKKANSGPFRLASIFTDRGDSSFGSVCHSVTKTWAWSPAPKAKAKLDTEHWFPALRKQKQAGGWSLSASQPSLIDEPQIPRKPFLEIRWGRGALSVGKGSCYTSLATKFDFLESMWRWKEKTNFTELSCDLVHVVTCIPPHTNNNTS